MRTVDAAAIFRVLYNRQSVFIADRSLDLIQLYTATQRVVESLKTSGLMPALRAHRLSLRGQGDRASAQAGIEQASSAYIKQVAAFGDDESAVVSLLHLNELGSPSFWQDLTLDTRPVELRLGKSVTAYSKIMFAVSHLPGLLSLVRETRAIDGLRSDDPENGILVLRLYDAEEPASSPDRMSRLIDAVDLLYSACALMSVASSASMQLSSATRPPSLQLMSVSGVAVRSVVFRGDASSITTTRNVINKLNQAAADASDNGGHRVESIASSMPLLDAVDALHKLKTLDTAQAETISRRSQEGAIMLLDCGAQLVDHESSADDSLVPGVVVASLDADEKSFEAIDASVVDMISDGFDEIYLSEKLKLVNEPSDMPTPPDNSDTGTRAKRGSVAGKPSIGSVGGTLRGDASNEANSDGSSTVADNIDNAGTTNLPSDAASSAHAAENIDKLITDLNRLYGEQR